MLEYTRTMHVTNSDELVLGVKSPNLIIVMDIACNGLDLVVLQTTSRRLKVRVESATISQLNMTSFELTIEWELMLIVTINPNDKNGIDVYFRDRDRLLATLLYYDNLMVATKSLPPHFP
ncbi:hypothetical protein ACFX13_036161 [Malus domestica]